MTKVLKNGPQPQFWLQHQGIWTLQNHITAAITPALVYNFLIHQGL